MLNGRGLIMGKIFSIIMMFSWTLSQPFAMEVDSDYKERYQKLEKLSLVLDFTKFEKNNAKEIVDDLQVYKQIATESLRIKTFKESKNRYDNIIIPSYTLVNKDSKNYINANYMDPSFIQFKDGKFFFVRKESYPYIGTQAPLSSSINGDTRDEFWAMVYDKDIKLIINLTSDVDKQNKRTSIYWPSLGKKRKFGAFDITNLEEKFSDDKAIITRDILIVRIGEERKLNNQNIVKIIHFKAWPDGSMPLRKDMKKLVSNINKLTTQGKSPTLVHCSAGVGRTGTLLGVLEIQKRKDQGKSMSLDEIDQMILSLRAQRGEFTVQTFEQVSFLYNQVNQARKK